MKINNKRELQNIAISHSADIDYQDFIKIYRECTKEPYNFLTIDSKLPASDPLRFRKEMTIKIKKMTITDQIKILNKKIMQNEAQYNLDRIAAKISALSSNNLDKYEYLTGEDLGLKPNTNEQAKFEYSPLGKTFNKRLSEEDKKEGLFKRLENIENAQKNLIKNDDNEIYTPKSEFDDKDKKQQTNNIDTKPSNIFNYLKSLSPEAKDLMDEIEKHDDDIDINKIAFIGSDREKFTFNTFDMPLNFLSNIYNGKI